MKNYIPLIFGMMAVTYLPRLIPMLALSKYNVPASVKRFLQYIPYTALGTLIVYGVISETGDMLIATAAGIAAAAICSWIKKDAVVLSVLACILVGYVVLSIL